MLNSFDSITGGTICSNASSPLAELLHYSLQQRAIRKEAERRVAEKITALYDKIGYFLWSFPSLIECGEQLLDLNNSLSDLRVFVAGASVLFSETTNINLKRFIGRCEYDLALWKRRSNGTASIEDWGIEPERDQYRGKLADYYRVALESLNGSILKTLMRQLKNFIGILVFSIFLW